MNNDFLVVGVFDKKAMEYINVNLERTDVVAIRSFENAVLNAPDSSLLSSHKDDFALYHIGYVDMVSGVLTDVTPVILIDGTSIVR